MKWLKALCSAVMNQIAIWLAIPLTFFEGSVILANVGNNWILPAFIALFFINAMLLGWMFQRVSAHFSKRK